MKKKLLLRATVPGLTKLLFCFFVFLFFAFQSYSQTVTGKVTDANGKGVADVTVAVKGSTVATVTNPAGQYSITEAASRFEQQTLTDNQPILMFQTVHLSGGLLTLPLKFQQIQRM